MVLTFMSVAKMYSGLHCNDAEARIKSRAITQTRTDDALMHKNRVAQKRKIQVGYNGITDEKAGQILRAINPEYIRVTYFDLMAGQNETRWFYVGDRSSPFKWWWDGKHILESLTFDLIER